MGLKDKSTYELAKLYHDRMSYNYLTVPDMEYNYPNSYEGDCMRIAHELALRVLEDEE